VHQALRALIHVATDDHDLDPRPDQSSSRHGTPPGAASRIGLTGAVNHIMALRRANSELLHGLRSPADSAATRASRAAR